MIGTGIAIGISKVNGLYRAIQAMFANNEKGVWFDPSDFSTLFQDSAGTTPVTAVGQSVGRIEDKSGNGFHATQAITASKPILRQDAGGLYYLEFDGVDDWLATAAIDFSATDKMGVFAGISALSFAARSTVVELSTSYGNPGAFAIEAPNPSLVNGMVAHSGSAGNATANLIPSLSVNTKAVVALISEQTIPSLYAKHNGTVSAIQSGAIGAGPFGNYPLYIGRRAGTSQPFNGHLYSLIVRGALCDSTQVAKVEAYVNSKTRAY